MNILMDLNFQDLPHILTVTFQIIVSKFIRIEITTPKYPVFHSLFHIYRLFLIHFLGLLDLVFNVPGMNYA